MYYTFWCCFAICWLPRDIHKHDWFSIVFDSIFALVCFLGAHHSWEKGYYEE